MKQDVVYWEIIGTLILVNRLKRGTFLPHAQNVRYSTLKADYVFDG
ncbi:MAG: hypothetical protein PHI13_04520 [Methylococcales bacterium]|nr:hypothetical protein [Methylococcales bacterium]